MKDSVRKENYHVTVSIAGTRIRVMVRVGDILNIIHKQGYMEILINTSRWKFDVVSSWDELFRAGSVVRSRQGVTIKAIRIKNRTGGFKIS